MSAITKCNAKINVHMKMVNIINDSKNNSFYQLIKL